jgi:hypothetical protein
MVLLYLFLEKLSMLIWILLLLAACSPNSSEDFQHEGEAQSRRLTQFLQKVENREQLLKAVPKLKLKFNKLVDLMIEARKFEQSHPDEISDPFSLDMETNQALIAELKRIYKMEGGRETIEKAQKEALLRLDLFENNLSRDKIRGG